MDENEEYKARIKNLIEDVEKNRDENSLATEQDLIEAKARLLRSAKARIHPYFRSEMVLLAFVFTIRDYYKKRKEIFVRSQFQEEIDELYKLIYEELIKPNPSISNSDPRFKKKMEKLDRKRILSKMTEILGLENLFRDFYKHYDIKEATRTDKYKKEIIQLILIIIFVIIASIFIFNGFDGVGF